MKTRNGFVSNSSSSSFVIIAEGGHQEPTPNWAMSRVLHLGDSVGETEFGWGPETIRGLGSRLNLAWILSENDSDRRYELEKALRERFPNIKEVEFHSTYPYVDHQSFDSMSDDVFRDEESLRNFLFLTGSEIHLDNDNH